MAAHARRREEERAHFARLCAMQPPKPVHVFATQRGHGPENAILRAVDQNGKEHFFVQKREAAPEEQIHPISAEDAIGFIVAGEVPDCLFEMAMALLYYGAAALEEAGNHAICGK
jgi:hypothetical protein